MAQRRACDCRRPHVGRSGHRRRYQSVLLRRRRRRSLEDDQQRIDVAKRLAARRSRRNRRHRDRSARPQYRVGWYRRAELFATTFPTATAFGFRTTAARTGAMPDCEPPGRSRKSSSIRATRAAFGWRRPAIRIATARRAAFIARPTVAERGSARSISVPRAALRTSQSIRAIPTSSLRESGSSAACLGALRSGGPLDGIFKSTDGGVTWHRLRGNGLPRRIDGPHWFGSSLAASNKTATRVYALDSIERRRNVAVRRRRHALAIDDARHARQPAAVLHEPSRRRSLEPQPRLLLLRRSDRDARRGQ